MLSGGNTVQRPLPGSTKDKLENSAAYVRENAQRQGVVYRLEFELFKLSMMAREALEKESTDLAKEALAYEQTLLTLIKDTPAPKASYNTQRR